MKRAIFLSSCVLDVEGQLVIGPETQHLTDREAELLAYLYARLGEDVSRETLLEEVWGYSPQVISRAVDFAIRRLRLKIEADPSNPTHLQTRYGTGYRLIIPESGPAPLFFEPPFLCALVPDREGLAAPDALESALAEAGGWLGAEGPSLILAAFPEADALGHALEHLPRGALGVAIAQGPVEIGVSVVARRLTYGGATAEDLRSLALSLGPGEVAWGPLPPHIRDRLERAGEEVRGDPSPGAPPAAQIGALFGRAELLQTLHGLGAPGGPSLISLVGPPGSGKTRLATAFQQGEGLPQAREGEVLFCALGGADTPQAALEAIAAVLGVQLGEHPSRQLGRALAAREPTWLILDNCEHLQGPIATLVTALLTLAPRCRLLITSRVGLGLPEEVTLPVGPLDPEAGMALLSHWAGASAMAPPLPPSPEARALVAHLDGLPLALKLAASCLGVCGLSELLTRLREGQAVLLQRRAHPEGCGTLGETLQISWSLIPQPARDLLLALSPFDGGFDLKQAEILAQVAGWEAEDVLPLLELLRRHHLITPAPGSDPQGMRLVLFRIIRDFVQSMAKDATLAEARHHHARALLTQGAALQAQLYGPAPEPFLRWLRENWLNLTLAAGRMAKEDPALFLALMPLVSDLSHDGLGTMEVLSLTALAADARPTGSDALPLFRARLARLKVLSLYSHVEVGASAWAQLQEVFESGPPEEQAAAYWWMALIEGHMLSVSQALELCEAGLRVLEGVPGETGRPERILLRALHHVLCALAHRDPARGGPDGGVERALRELGAPFLDQSVHFLLGICHRMLRQTMQAKRSFQRALRSARSLSLTRRVLLCEAELLRASVVEGGVEEVRRLAQETLDFSREVRARSILMPAADHASRHADLLHCLCAFDEEREALARLLIDVEDQGLPSMHLYALYSLCLNSAQRRDLRGAAEWLGSLKGWRPPEAPALIQSHRAFVSLGEGFLAALRGAFEEGAMALQRLPRVPIPIFGFYLLERTSLEICLALCRGDLPLARVLASSLIEEDSLSILAPPLYRVRALYSITAHLVDLPPLPHLLPRPLERPPLPLEIPLMRLAHGLRLRAGLETDPDPAPLKGPDPCHDLHADLLAPLLTPESGR